MRKLRVFDHLTLDGCFTDANSDMSWAYGDPNDAEWNAFVAGNAGGHGALVFGRVTYQMMAGFWPTQAAMESMPAVAAGMNRMPKIVFSRTLERADWNNTTLLRDLVPGVRKLKSEAGPDMVILGSGSTVAQLAQEGLIDEYQLVLNPIALGNGRTLFADIREPLHLKLTKSRTFGNGKVVLWYAA